MGLEPTPGPWQGPVLPLYYGRPNQRNSNTSAFRRQEPRGMEIDEDPTIHPRPQACPIRHPLRNRETVGSADLQYPRGLHDGGLPLPLGKFGGFFPVRIDASKSLPVLVKDSYLPVLVLAPPIFPKFGAFSCGFCFGHNLNISMAIRARKYQFNQYFARNLIILHYRVGCNAERQVTGYLLSHPRIRASLAHSVNLSSPRHTNEHDHKFGILLPPTAASNKCRRNLRFQWARKRWKAGKPVYV